MKRNDVASHLYGPMTHYELGYGCERAGKYPEAIQEWEEAMTGLATTNWLKQHTASKALFANG